jgi:type VI secretion system secreted protein VgrG
MNSYTQDKRPLAIQTPLGKDKLLLVGIAGHEAISQLFQFQLEALAENKNEIAFEKLLGQSVTVELEAASSGKRYFNGIVSKAIEGAQDRIFTEYTLEIVPKFWLLTRKTHSRIFQHIGVPDILKKVFDGLDVTYDLQGSFQARDYCVQYRETDFNFASRLMEEEGIYYFFKHSSGNHQMVVANTPEGHADVPISTTAIFEGVEGGERDEDRVFTWVKTQELRSGKYTLWDHCFELPHKHLDADKTIIDSVAAGSVNHKLNVANNQKLEIYDFPGEYAQRFDGINGGGGEQPEELQKIFEDNQRTVGIRMEEEAASSLLIQGASGCRQFTSGHKFNIQRHFNADGSYVLISVRHAGREDSYRTAGEDFSYSNAFTCIPFELPYRPGRISAKPVVPGTQTAVVVGPSGEEIFTDKYGRVKVQFHWDRDGKNDSDSSCWVRVATSWAGKQWGSIYIPRIGQEVVVDFLEGDPDQPIIVGSVYNADMMPPYTLPKEKTKSTVKSRSTLNGGTSNWNEIRLEDKKGNEQIFINAEKDLDLRVENDAREFIGNDRHLIVKANQLEQVGQDNHAHVKGDHLEKIDGDMSLQVGGERQEKIGTVDTIEAGQEIHLKAGMQIIIEAGAQISLIGAGGFIDIGPSGVTIQGTMVLINSGGAAGSGTDSDPDDPKDPDVADDGTKTGKLNS